VGARAVGANRPRHGRSRTRALAINTLGVRKTSFSLAQRDDRSGLQGQTGPGPRWGREALPPLYVISTRFRIFRRAFFEKRAQNGQEASSFPFFEKITTEDPISCRWLRREATGGGLHAAARAAAPVLQAGSIVRPTMRHLLRLASEPHEAPPRGPHDESAHNTGSTYFRGPGYGYS